MKPISWDEATMLAAGVDSGVVNKKKSSATVMARTTIALMDT